jgi:alpha-L-arabinofuranosidase
MTTAVAQELKSPMLACLKRIVSELPAKLNEVNISVEKGAEKSLDLKIVSVAESGESDFHIQVQGVTHSGKVDTQTFKVSWVEAVLDLLFLCLLFVKYSYLPGFLFLTILI